MARLPRLPRAALALAVAAACSSPAVETPGAGGPAGAAGTIDPARGGAGGGGGADSEGPGFMFTVPDAAPPVEAGSLFESDKGCNRLDVKFEKTVPTVAVVVDRSSSMYDPYDRAGNRWEVLKKALLDPATGLVKQNEADIRFGLFTYTSTQKAPTCPALGVVSFAMGNYAAIEKLYGPLLPPTAQEKGETPTGETIEKVTEELLKVTEGGPRYVLLASDGEPDTCPGTCTGGSCPVPDRAGWPRDPNCGHDRSLSAVQAAFKKGIKTFVLGLGADLGAEHLQSLANAGAGLPVVLGKQAEWLQYSCNLPPAQWKGTYATTAGNNAKYYKPADGAALAADLKTIIDSVRTCTFALKGMVELERAELGQVRLDGQGLTFKGPDGWRMNSESELELVGKACQQLQASSRLEVAFPCTVFKPVL